MQLFFNKPTQAAKVIPRDQIWNYTKAALKRNLQVTVDYYQSKGFAVKSNHLLVKVLNSIGVDHGFNIERFYDIVNAKTNKIGMHFKMTSPIYSGQIFDGIFYGPGTNEIIIVDDEYISPYEIQKNWKNIQSVKVLDHPRSDLRLLLPNGKQSSTDTGLATISINISALATQYREFMKEQAAEMREGENSLLTATFVHRYVLPNMLYTHQDVALFNRINNMVLGKPMGEATFKHPFVLLDYTRFADQVYWQLKDLLVKNEYDFKTILKSIPLVNVPDASELMRLPELAPTRQLAWAEFVARLKCIRFLSACTPSHGHALSMKDLNYFVREIQLYSSSTALSQISDREIYNDVLHDVSDIVHSATSANIVLR